MRGLLQSLLMSLLLLANAAFAAAVDFALPPFERVTLDNGTVLLLSEKHETPLVGMTVLVRGGALADPQGLDGLATLTAAMLEKGAGDRDAAAFAEAAAGVGGIIAASGESEAVSIRADFLSRDVDLMLELVSDMLLRPTLDAEEFERERERRIGMITAAKGSSPGRLIGNYAHAFLFGAHPYGRPAGGSESSLAAISHEDLTRHYRAHFGGDRLIIAVAGDFDQNAMRERLEALFGGWRAAEEDLPAVAAPAAADGRRVLLIDKPGATQTDFWIGNTGIPVDYPRRAEADIANTLFGGRFTSMLMTALRVEAGLTYSARSVLDRRSAGGVVAMRSFTETSQTVAAIDMALDVLGRLLDEEIDDDAVRSATNYIMGQFPPTLETVAALANMLAYLEQHGLDRRFIDDFGAALAIASTASVNAVVAEVYPSPDNLVFVIVGDAARIRDDIARYGAVTEMPLTAPSFVP